jgi:segregation and condensation protein A
MADSFTTVQGDLVFELDSFDGPLDLLLYLIKREEIDIYDIPVAEITRQYLGYLEVCTELNLEIAGEFLYMASLLIRIKAQMLLPRPEDEEGWEDPRSELVNALLEYKKVKRISSTLDNMAQNMRMRYTKGHYSDSDIPRPEPELKKVDITALMLAFGEVLQRVKPEHRIEIARVEVTVEDRKERILDLFREKESLEFSELFSDDPRKIVLVVTFIALLDLVKNSILRVEQADRFMPIRVYLNREPALIAED